VLRKHIVEDWHWVVNHSWSVRLIMLAFVLSAAEAIMPLLSDYAPHPIVYGVVTGLVTAGAFVARLLAQKKIDADAAP
jgi:hypothetical protein